MLLRALKLFKQRKEESEEATRRSDMWNSKHRPSRQRRKRDAFKRALLSITLKYKGEPRKYRRRMAWALIKNEGF